MAELYDLPARAVIAVGGPPPAWFKEVPRGDEATALRSRQTASCKRSMERQDARGAQAALTTSIIGLLGFVGATLMVAA